MTCLDLPMTSSANATFSNAVLFGSSLKSWKTQPMLRRRYGTFQFFILTRSWPATMICPRLGQELAQQQPDERRLARARVAHDEDELARADLDVDVVEGGLVGDVGLRDAPHRDHDRPRTRQDRRYLGGARRGRIWHVDQISHRDAPFRCNDSHRGSLAKSASLGLGLRVFVLWRSRLNARAGPRPPRAMSAAVSPK